MREEGQHRIHAKITALNGTLIMYGSHTLLSAVHM